MIRLILLYILIVSCLLIRANEDSLIVQSLIEQSKRTQSQDTAILYADKALKYAEKHVYTDGILTVAKHFGNLYAQTGALQQSIDLY